MFSISFQPSILDRFLIWAVGLAAFFGLGSSILAQSGSNLSESTASAPSLSDAGEFPANATIKGNAAGWRPILDVSFPDGDAVELDGGYVFPYGSQSDESRLVVPIQGPVVATFHAQGDVTVYVNGCNHDVNWSLDGDGWKTAEFQIPPGAHVVSIQAWWPDRVLLDRWSTTPAEQLLTPSLVFPIPGVTFTTNPDNPFMGISFDGQPTSVVYGSTVQNGSEAWLEMNCVGPAIVRFRPEKGCSNGYPEAFFDFTVDGASFWAPFGVPWQEMANGQPYALCLSAGPHTLRWRVMPPEGDEIPSAVKLSGLSLTPTPEFVVLPAGEIGAFLWPEAAPVEVLVESGVPVFRKPSGTAIEPHRFLDMTWQASQPGRLRFLARALPGDDFGFRYINVYNAAGSLSRTTFLSLGEVWQEVVVDLDQPGLRVNLDFPGVDLSEVRFSPWKEIALNEAIGLPGLNFTSASESLMRGFEDAAGHRWVQPSPLPMESDGNFMECIVNGPVELNWRVNHGTATGVRGGKGAYAVMGDQYVLMNPQAKEDLSLRHEWQYSIQVPSGEHVVKWYYHGGSPQNGEPTPQFDQFTSGPLSTAYLAWRPVPNGETEGIPLATGGDEDHDGDSNLVEFTYGTDPFKSDARSTPVLGWENGSLTVTYPQPRPLIDGVKVTIQTSSNLKDWSDAIVTPLPAPAGKVKFQLTASMESVRDLYLRTKVELLPP